ncbi:hypothetical protein JS530_10160 [Bifidobacterium sp. LC6]|uniref:Integral membrane protein n=1 Tax=Bifidobacterium colobi TaxID=2809026 RepID=A0ABS5UXK4_9BIFI|nr:hypothetical protein [Bifidobacterium colobi]MBT1175854.1 hypothetical protein [Bifidobacterium colobi]
MMELLFSYVYDFREFICVSALAVIAAACVLPWLAGRFDYRSGRGTVMFLLHRITVREAINLAADVLMMLFVITNVVFGKEIAINSVAALLVFGIMIVATNFQLRTLIIEILDCALLSALLIAGDIMGQYLALVRLDVSVLVLYVALNVFTITYAIFMCVQHVLDLKARRQDTLANKLERQADIAHEAQMEAEAQAAGDAFLNRYADGQDTAVQSADSAAAAPDDAPDAAPQSPAATTAALALSTAPSTAQQSSNPALAPNPAPNPAQTLTKEAAQ